MQSVLKIKKLEALTLNEIINAVKNGQKVEATDLLNVVNDFCLTRLRLRIPDGKVIMSMQVNTCKEYSDEYVFSQSCTMFDDVVYYLKKDNIETVEGEYNSKVDTLYITCKLKDNLELLLMIINTSGSLVETKDYNEMDVYELKGFLDDVIHEKNGYYCILTRITDVFGFDLKINNPVRTYINTLDEEDWKLHIGEDFTQFEIPVTDDSVNEIYVKDNEESGSKNIVIKPYNQPFMEISMLFFKKHE